MGSSGFVVTTSQSGEVTWPRGARDCFFTQILLHSECVLIAAAGILMGVVGRWFVIWEQERWQWRKPKVHWGLRELSLNTVWWTRKLCKV